MFKSVADETDGVSFSVPWQNDEYKTFIKSSTIG